MIARIDLVTDDAGDLDSLRQSIAELREEIVLRIEAAIDRLRRLQAESLYSEAASPPIRVRPASHPEPEDPAPSSSPAARDPRDRLDALARLLDHRLGKTRDAAPGGEVSTGSARDSGT
jgi:hypothetical protein